jgi:signal transduction histidine kinase
MDAHSNRFFKDFTPQGRDRLLSCLVLESYSDRTYLFHEREPADGVCLVLTGDVEILRTSNNREQILGHFSEGDFLGEVAVLDGGARSACARAHGPVTVAKIPKEPLLEVLLAEPVTLTLGLFQQLLVYFRRTNDLFMGEVLHKEKLALVGEMASSLMHDLRNPLTGIRLSAEVMNLRNSEDEETARCCAGIQFQCDRIAAMTHELLEFSRGDVTLQLRRTTTTGFLQQFQSLHEEYFRETGMTFDIKAEPAEIEIDEMRCLRLLQNLVTNAVEAMIGTSGGRIEIRAWVQEHFFHLTISDNGPGIPDAIRDRVFEPFVTHGKKGGIGLGMAIVDNVVTAHHGKIKLETGPDKGTLFVIELPQFSPNSHEHPEREEEAHTRLEAAARHHRHPTAV